MLDIKQFLDIEVPHSIRISPSGHQVVYTTSLTLGHRTGDNAVSTIWLAEVGIEKSARQLTSGSFHDQQPEFSPDGESIAFISDRAKPGKTSAIYLLSLKGGEAYPLTPAENESGIEKFSWSPDGNSIAFLSPDEKTAEQKAKDEAKDDADVFGEDWKFNRLRLAHVSTKNISTLVKIDAHVTHLGWRGDGSALVFTHQKTTELESPYVDGQVVERISIVDKTVKTLSKSNRLQGGTTGLCWVGDRIYFIAGFDREELVTSETFYSISDSDEDGQWKLEASGETDCAEDLLKSGDSILFHVKRGLYSEIRDIKGKVLFSAMTDFDSWHTVRPASSSTPVLCLTKSDPSHPAEVFSITSDASTLTQLSNHGHAFTSPLGTATPLSIPTTDGTTTLDAIFVTPSTTSSSAPLPTVVLIHGGPYMRATATFDILGLYGWGALLLSAGYAVLYPNYRGSAGRGNAFASAARAGMGTVEYEDVVTTTQHCISKGLADPSRLVVGGWSQGGFLSYLAAVRNGGDAGEVNFRAAICGAGVTDWDTMALTSDVPGFESALAGTAPWLCTSKTDILSRRGSALWEFAAAVKSAEGKGKGKGVCATLVLHGKDDVRVPVNQAWGWHRACRRWGVPCEMVVYPREGHLFEERAHWADMAGRVSRFCDVHLSKM